VFLYPLWAQSQPVIVKIVETPSDPTGIADTIVGAIGLSGAITLIAALFGVLTAGLLFWLRRKSPLQ
jgi:hypothetical protein